MIWLVKSSTTTHPIGTSPIAAAASARLIASRISVASSVMAAMQARVEQLLLHRHNCGHFRHAFAEVAFDALVERHAAAGTAVAGAVEADLDLPVGIDVDQLDVAAVSLHGGADQVDHALDPLAHRLGRMLRSGH